MYDPPSLMGTRVASTKEEDPTVWGSSSSPTFIWRRDEHIWGYMWISCLLHEHGVIIVRQACQKRRHMSVRALQIVRGLTSHLDLIIPTQLDPFSLF